MYRAMLLGAILSGLSVSPAALAAPHVEEFHAVFSGFNEVGGLNAQTGAILSDGRATLELRLNRADQTLSFVLKYSGLAAGVTQAHKNSMIALHNELIRLVPRQVANARSGLQHNLGRGGGCGSTLHDPECDRDPSGHRTTRLAPC